MVYTTDSMSGETLRIRKQITQGNLLFGEYTLQHVLAQGRIGVLCEAEHNSLKRPCALKMVHPGVAERDGFTLALVDAFLKEARILATIDHPAIIPIYHAGTVGQCPFIAMRLVRGSLQRRITASGALSLDWGLRMMRQAAEGVRAIHASGHVHAAIQPDHVLLEADGAPRLAGFGHAQLLDTARPASAASPFTAPETMQVVLAEPRADLWSLGATIANALTGGEFAWSEDVTAESIAQQIVMAAPVAARSPQLPGLASMLARLLFPEPGSRYASAEALVDDCLRLTAGHEPIHALGKSRFQKDHFSGWKKDDPAEEPFPE